MRRDVRNSEEAAPEENDELELEGGEDEEEEKSSGGHRRYLTRKGAERMHKELLRLLNEGDHDAVPAQLMRWTRIAGKESRGLRNRRTAEAALWNTA